MRIKNIKLSFLILGSLMILSFAFFSAAEESSTTSNNVFLDSDQDGLSDTEEKTYGTDPLKADTDSDSYSDGAEVRAGYDPTKPAPGDRVVEEPVTLAAGESVAEKENLTKEITDKVSLLVEDANSAVDGDGEISMADVQAIVDASLQSEIQKEELPEIDASEIKVKIQDYEKLSEEERELKKKEDFLAYFVGVSYVIGSNSPKPVTSEGDFMNMASSFGQQISSAVATQNPAALETLAVSGERITDQLKDMEVPEEIVDLHVKGLQFSQYAIQLKDGLLPNPEDPMQDVLKFSKMQGLMELIGGFELEAGNMISQYGVTTVENAEKELKTLKTGTEVK